MPRLPFSPLFILSAALLSAVPCGAQAKIGTAPRPAAPTSLPLLVGAALGGLALGGALGFALKKPAAPKTSGETDPLFDEAPIPLALVDANEKIGRANAAFSRFVGIPDATGQVFSQWLHPDDLARVRALFSDVFSGASAQSSGESRFFRADGTLLHATLSIKKQGQKREPDTVLLGLQEVTARVEAQNELSGAREAISALYEVIAGDKSRDLDAKIKSLLAMGCGRFELPVGVLGRFAGDEFETLFVQSVDRRIRPALTFSRADTDSSEARLLGLSQLPTRANWRDFPVVAVNAGHAYLGAPVAVDGELFGMLSFSGLEARPKLFGDESAALLQLMAQWVGAEIEREEARDTLERQQLALVAANEKLEQLATHDPLTGAKNRRAFNDKLAEEWSRAVRYGTPLSLVLMDVDKFKSYNDTFGHPAGDEVLKKVALTLMAAVRTTDFFARYGGEEFVLLLPSTDAEGAMILADRLRQKIEGASWKERGVTASMGVASLTGDIKNAAALTQAADDALYQSKKNGRNRVTHVRDVPPDVV
ncbi:MAG: diguanylate cyclase [Armatimonadetes bacterium]|nr:diguanylate cyclase [Armatimonadota bacterium]